jgi:uncharacterized protein YacL
MHRTTELLFRIGGAVVGSVVFTLLGQFLLFIVNALSGSQPLNQSLTLLVAALVGLVVGYIFATGPLKSARQTLAGMSGEQFTSATLGGLLGLVAAALLAVPLATLPVPLRSVVPTVLGLALVYLGFTTFAKRNHDVENFLRRIRPNATEIAAAAVSMNDGESIPDYQRIIILDTSVIIDGRITDVTKTGFVTGSLLVPNFVLNELQHIADNPDPIRRKRGRRGLDILEILQTECPIQIEINDVDVSESREVDHKLVALARHMEAPIMTNDYNLNRVASLQGVTVLNINDLANAVKAAYLPGEELSVKIIQEGRESGQGVGYLDDGTMVVIEDGMHYLNQAHRVVVTKVLQTTAGRMIFARLP